MPSSPGNIDVAVCADLSTSGDMGLWWGWLCAALDVQLNTVNMLDLTNAPTNVIAFLDFSHEQQAEVRARWNRSPRVFFHGHAHALAWRGVLGHD